MARSGFRVGKDVFLFEEERNWCMLGALGKELIENAGEILNKEEMSSGTQAWNLL